MKRALLYGKADKLIPWYDGFQMCADGSINFHLCGVDTFEIEENQEIRWLDLFNAKLNKLVTDQEISEAVCNAEGQPLAIYERYVERLWDNLKLYCNLESQAEKDFFDLYCDLSWSSVHTGAFLPALIPHVYINWHFSKTVRAKKEIPYIVDFIFKSSIFGTNDLVIVEIDGFSHYANYEPTNRMPIASEKLYAEHLKKDRCLRKQGFKVFRIGNAEIKNIMLLSQKEKTKYFYYFFREVFGEIIWSEQFYFS